MRHFVKLLIVLSCIICWAGLAQAYTWYPYNGHSYALIGDRLTWVEAEQVAVSQGAHLVTINDLAEQNWLVTQFGSGGSYWIGLYQLPGSIEPDQGFVWVSGEPVTFTNWAPLEPNNLGDEMYVAMNEHAAGW